MTLMPLVRPRRPRDGRRCEHRNLAATHAARVGQDGELTANQVDCIEPVLQELTQGGRVPPERLFEPPFTDGSALRPTMASPAAQVTRIVEARQDIRARAAA